MTTQRPTRSFIVVNEKGRRIGESHPRARLSDHEVDLMLTLREEYHMSYGMLAAKFECSKSSVAKLCKYERRCQTPAAFKPVSASRRMQRQDHAVPISGH